MTSTRLPGKAFLKIGERTVLDTLVNRLCLRGYNPIILTSNDKYSNPIQSYASDKGLQILRGNENDVLSRFISLNDTERIKDLYALLLIILLQA